MVFDESITDDRFAYSFSELARRLCVSVGFLRLEVQRGKLRPTRLGRRVLVSSLEARRYIFENTSK